MTKIPKAIAPFVFILAVTGCDLFLGSGEPPPCPRISVLPDAQTLTKFREGAGRDLIDILFEVKIVNVRGGCEYDIDEETGAGMLTAELDVGIGIERGPANHDRRAEFEYFVSVVVTDASRNILNKQPFPVAVEFPGNRTRLVFADNDPPVTLDFPLKPGRTGKDFEIVIGLQLSPEELEYNRRRRAMGGE